MIDFTGLLKDAPLAQHMAPADLQSLAGLAEPLFLQGGEVLYAEGEAPAYLYVVAGGRLRLVSGQDALIGYSGYGDVVGEAGVISGEPRTATVRAVRDSVVLRLPRAKAMEFLAAHGLAAVALARRLVLRARETRRERELASGRGQVSVAVFPATTDAPAMALAEILARGLSGWPRVRVITAAHVDATLGDGAAQAMYAQPEISRRLAEWVCQLERRHQYLIFVADAPDSHWALRCLRQADRVLVLAEADAVPAVPQALAEWRGSDRTRAPVELVLLRPEGDPSPHTLGWQQATGARAHFHVHPWDPQDVAALQRQISGRGIGIVLGGGGARGFAHIGLLRAMEQLQIPVDVSGGTSMGAFVAALAACGYDTVEMAQIARETFVTSNYLNDYMLPGVALIKARRFLARLKDIFGERRIEELRRTYYCVSSNLSTGAAVVHDRGPLAEWVGTSMAVPGVAPPIAWNEHLLCDGGVVNNLPTDIMQNLERGVIIASSVSAVGDLSAPGGGIKAPEPDFLLTRGRLARPPSFTEILLRTATLNSDTTLARAAIDRADIFLRMPVGKFGMFDWKRIDELIELGYAHALEQLKPLRESLLHAEAGPQRR